MPAPTCRDAERIATSKGDLQLCGFPNLNLAAHGAADVHGIRVAVPAMLALVNLIGHARESTAIMSKPIMQRHGILRSSKDLGRLLTLAYLTEEAPMQGLAPLEEWPRLWRDALQAMYPSTMLSISSTCGDGLKRMSQDDYRIAEAHHTAIHGLLGAHPDKPTVKEFAALIPLVLKATARPQQYIADSSASR